MGRLPWLVLVACLPEGPGIASVRELPVVDQGAIVGRDGGSSARLFGRSVWTFGDTVITATDGDGRTWHHNSWASTDDEDASDGLALIDPACPDGAPSYLIAETPAERAFNASHWDDGDCLDPCGARHAVRPGSPVWDVVGARAFLFYGIVHAAPGDFNFEGAGGSVAVWSDAAGVPKRPEIDPTALHPDVLWPTGAWGNGAAIDDGHLTTFGCDQDGLAHACKLARAPLDDAQVPAAWRYWDGRRWQASASAARVLFEGAPILSLHFSRWHDAWMVVYSPPFDDRILARTAPHLTGPWSRPSVLTTVADPDPPYDAVAHVELAHDDGRVLPVSWTRATEGWFGRELALVEVTFE